MDEYIDRIVLIEKCHPVIDVGMSLGNIGVTLDEIREIPTVDAVEVVRCKDCKHLPFVMAEDYMTSGKIIPPDKDERNGDYTCPFLCYDSFYSKVPPAHFFCANGERRAEND